MLKVLARCFRTSLHKAYSLGRILAIVLQAQLEGAQCDFRFESCYHSRRGNKEMLVGLDVYNLGCLRLGSFMNFLGSTPVVYSFSPLLVLNSFMIHSK